MRGHSLFLIPLMVVSGAMAQQPGRQFPAGTAGVDYNRHDREGRRDGPWIRIYRDNPSTLYYSGQFSHGVPTGVFSFFAVDGSLMSTVDHVQDSTINEVTYYHPGGSVVMSRGQYEGRLVNGKWSREKQGRWMTYDDRGTLRADEHYRAGQLDGECRYSYPDGKLVAVYSYRGGLKDGAFTTYYPNGRKEKEGSCLLGDFHGEYRVWHENGALKVEGRYVNGQPDGTWHYYQSSGIPELSILYKSGTEKRRKYENGTFTEYYESGIPRSEYTYEDGKRNGPFTEWYDAGEFVTVPGSLEDVQAGIEARQELTGTQVRVRGDYVDDHPEGEVTYFTLKGTIEKIELWEGGQLTSTRQPGK